MKADGRSPGPGIDLGGTLKTLAGLDGRERIDEMKHAPRHIADFPGFEDVDERTPRAQLLADGKFRGCEWRLPHGQSQTVGRGSCAARGRFKLLLLRDPARSSQHQA